MTTAEIPAESTERRQLIAELVAPIDIVAALGAGLLTVGLALIYIPAAFIALGALLLAYAVAVTRAGGEA